eukprot:354557-Chlamydomonas_euryale.AAC.2
MVDALPGGGGILIATIEALKHAHLACLDCAQASSWNTVWAFGFLYLPIQVPTAYCGQQDGHLGSRPVAASTYTGTHIFTFTHTHTQTEDGGPKVRAGWLVFPDKCLIRDVPRQGWRDALGPPPPVDQARRCMRSRACGKGRGLVTQRYACLSSFSRNAALNVQGVFYHPERSGWDGLGLGRGVRMRLEGQALWHGQSGVKVKKALPYSA